MYNATKTFTKINFSLSQWYQYFLISSWTLHSQNRYYQQLFITKLEIIATIMNT